MIIDEEYFLEQSGVKGMRWGQRRRRDKAKLIGAGVVGYGVANAGQMVLYKKTKLAGNPLAAMGLSAATAAAAVNVTRNILNKKGNVKVPRQHMKTAKVNAKAEARQQFLNSPQRQQP